jgi:ABC-type multidrug transport system fused ATPase/permease subunit
MPVITSITAAELINILGEAIVAHSKGLNIEFSRVLGILVIQFVLIFANGLVSNINIVVTRISGELVANHVKEMIMDKAKTVDLKSFDKPDFYERLENAEREAGMRPVQILSAVFNLVSAIISMVSFVAVLFAISTAAPFIIILFALPSAIISFVYRKKAFNYVRIHSKDRRQLNYYSGLMTNKDMVKEIKIFGLSDLFVVRYREVFKRYFAGIGGIYLKEGIWKTVISFASAAVNCILFLYVARKVWMGQLQIGDYTLYTGALNSISSLVATLISTTATIYEGTLFIDNLITFMKEKTTISPNTDTPLEVKRHIGHTIELKNVSFKYPGAEEYVIKNMSGVIKGGSSVVLVGLNGAGKTTLIKLITRLYDPTEGEILLDGVDIKQYRPEDIYKIFGIIFQDFGKYAVSVSENIYFGNVQNDKNEEKIAEAARQGNCTDFIERLPRGFDTALMRIFEEEGIELSIGQWQKLSIARAFYSDSDILILDEPTASLYAIAEQEVFNQFDALREGKTTIFVSHRLSSATTADEIWVIDQGALIEKGSHKELMDKKGEYYRLFSTQAKRYIESAEK